MKKRKAEDRHDYEDLPIELRSGKCFVNFKLNEKGAKVPVSVDGRPIDANSPRNWVKFNVALRAERSGRVDGIGLAIGSKDVVGIDIDHCVVNGRIAPWAKAIIERVSGYTEYSVSGRGIHVYVRGRPKIGDKRQLAVGDGAVDLFVTKGYLIVTGKALPGFERRRLLRRQQTVDQVMGEIERDSPVVKKVRSHPAFGPLWHGEIGDDDDRSAKDYALASHIAELVGPDATRIETLMRQSGLFREKWDRKSDPYLERTVAKVVAGRGNASERSLSFESIRDVVCSLTNFLKKALPPPEWLVERLFTAGTINMIFGSAGVGKSHFLYSLLYSLDQGTDFMDRAVPRKRCVLYIDTEMAERSIQKRLRAWYGDRAPAQSFLMSTAQFRSIAGTHFKLDNLAHQELLRTLIREFHVDVVIIDPLAPALDADENSNTEVETYMAFLTELRDEGVTVILSHHTGKSEDSGQRGASRRRDYLDVSIKLSANKISPAARFKVETDKAREEPPQPASWVAELSGTTGHHWKLEGVRIANDERLLGVLSYIHKHGKSGRLNITKMAKDLGLRPQRVYEVFKKARRQLLMEPKANKLTDEGLALVSESDE